MDTVAGFLLRFGLQLIECYGRSLGRLPGIDSELESTETQCPDLAFFEFACLGVNVYRRHVANPLLL